MYLITKTTFNSNGRLRDKEVVALLSNWDAVQSEVKNISSYYEQSDKYHVSWDCSGVNAYELEGMEKEFFFKVEKIEVKA